MISRVLVYQTLRILPILNFSSERLQKRTSWLRPHRENTWEGPRVHLNRSPEELDRSGQTEG